MWQGITCPMGARKRIENRGGNDKDGLEAKHQHGMRRTERYIGQEEAGGKGRSEAGDEASNKISNGL